MMDGKFWKNRRVALLGGANLIGTHLAYALKELTNDVVVVDNLSSGKIENVPDDVSFFTLDLRNYTDIMWMLEQTQVDTVFHLAAQHGGRGYVASHDVELYNNLELDTTIFRACAAAGVEKVIFSSSACAYPIDVQTNSDDVVYLSEDLIDYKKMRQADGAYGTE
jgi:nucleoside-diphosphate-sugar epimerase